MSPMNIAILVVSYRSLTDIIGCLAALEASTHTNFRVVIAENGGPSAFEQLDRALPERMPGGQPIERHLSPGNLGFAGGVNYCLDQAGPADAYWILNPDTEPQPDALAAMLERLKRNDCNAVGHDIQLPEGHLASRGGVWMPLGARSMSIDYGQPRDPRPDPERIEAQMNYAIGASMLVTPRFIQRVGRMREDYFLYCEEVEWCLRARSLNERIGYSPDALVIHARGSSTGGGGPVKTRSKISVYLMERNRLLLTRDLYSSLFPITSGLVLLKIVALHVRARAFKQLGFALQGWLAGWRNERGPPRWFVSPEEAPR